MQTFAQVIQSNAALIQKVVDFDVKHDRLLPLDFTAANTELTDEILDDTDLFSNWVNEKLAKNNALYGIGGYNEHRTIYSRSVHFDTEEEPRRLHLGVDIWAPVGTPIYNFYDATVQSFANNNNFGDYGATIILAYEIDGFKLNALYGHLSLDSLNDLKEGKFIPVGAKIATLGSKEENGYWPPHLHFQLIESMGGLKGDYPGVCKFSEREKYLANCPDPNLILRNTFY
ncbi:peptidoglycan DD-metalloendopeptidase family protein [Pedobacter sp. MR2016-19]|uniref:peptidoglycan DD-metalloendopeptidase family protein n=1 Tax=Pedobacter sp. MR2016-19 TaxID=2780089 RepID=UPI001876AD15|nr:peptidoglycan DD-metalloendopeptidase family protein [Pedobacter sp. MR2016-19]MBE5319753.1 peptidoglycan DD-metalloendopeptidase family protein [Pedobacter sp. MR2016-19]